VTPGMSVYMTDLGRVILGQEGLRIQGLPPSNKPSPIQGTVPLPVESLRESARP